MDNKKISPTKAAKRKKDNLTIIGLGLLVLIMLIMLVFMLISYSSDDETTTTQESTEIVTVTEIIDGLIEDTTEAATTEIETTVVVTSASTGRIIVDPTTDMWNLIVVNFTREFTSDYEPTLDEIFDTGYYLDYRVTPYYEQMYTDALADGVTLTPFSAYRSYARQETNYNARIALYMTDYNMSEEEAIAATCEVILPPGTSEHNLGIAIDIVCVEEYFEDTDEFTWLMENAYKYGFILRYAQDKSDITGVIYEPWHWRFVGVEYAEDIMNSGLCLEEYLDSVGIAY